MLYLAEDDVGIDLADVPQLPAVDDPEQRLDPFRVAGHPDRLYGAQMIASLVRDRFIEQARRNTLKEELFRYFGGREHMQRYWHELESAFAAALARALFLDLVHELPATDGGELRYVPGWLESDSDTAHRLRREGRWPG